MSRNQDDISKTSKSTLFSEDTSKLEWMYKSGSELLNREEYLLGKTIDRQFEKLDEEEKKQKALPGVTVPKNHVEHECIPYSIRNYRSVQNDEQVDIQRKILEDPLMSIRQKEMESRRRILENPVKLKELHRLLKKEREAGKKLKISKKGSKKKKEKRSKKKKKKERSASSSEDEDLDKLLAKKYRQIKEKFGANDGTFNLKDLLGKQGEEIVEDDKKLEKRRKRKVSSRDSDDDSSNEGITSKGSHRVSAQRPPPSQRKHFNYQENSKHDSRSRSQKISRDESSEDSTYNESNQEKHKRSMKSTSSRDRTTKKDLRKDNQSKKDNIGKGNRNDHEKDRNYENNSKYKSVSSKRKRTISGSSSSSASRDDTPPRRNYGLVTASGQKILLKGSSCSSDPKTGRNEQVKRTNQPQISKNHSRVKLTSEEREKLCQEMMQNAQWREKERKTKVDTYRKEYERETTATNNFDKNFINKELHKAMTSHASVESRLKSNINNIQRSGKAMESNFAKR